MLDAYDRTSVLQSQDLPTWPVASSSSSRRVLSSVMRVQEGRGDPGQSHLTLPLRAGGIHLHPPWSAWRYMWIRSTYSSPYCIQKTQEFDTLLHLSCFCLRMRLIFWYNHHTLNLEQFLTYLYGYHLHYHNTCYMTCHYHYLIEYSTTLSWCADCLVCPRCHRDTPRLPYIPQDDGSQSCSRIHGIHL